MNLTQSQRIMRRLCLWFRGSYTHPDGTIELDIDEPAGVDPTVDNREKQNAKFALYFQRQAIRERAGRRGSGTFLVGLAVYYLATTLGMPTWDAIGVGALLGFGLFLLTS